MEEIIKPGFYCMDCMEAMRQFPDGFFDLAIVDPPYGIGAERFANGSGAKDHPQGSSARRVARNRRGVNNVSKVLDEGFYHMDCMEGMKGFPDGYFDLAIVDPPYGIGAYRFKNGSGASKDAGEYGTAVRCRRQRVNGGGGKLAGRTLNRSDCSWDAEPPGEAYFKELMRVSKNQIIWGGNYFPLPPTRCVVVWDKKQPWENFSQAELAWTSFDKPVSIFRKANTGGGKIHPTQKPVELYAWLLSKYAQKGDKILDTHVGSASSLIACHRAGFRYWGFEIDEGYYRDAVARLEEEKAQISLFDCPEDG